MPAIEWARSHAPVSYTEACAAMEARVADIHAGNAREIVWILEHPPLYTAGTSARAADLLTPERFPVFRTGRGGQFTYHGPGQLVAYVMLDLGRRGRDLHRFVAGLEDWIIATLALFGITGERRAGRVGVWVTQPDGREEKIAAVGLRLRHWVSFHGASLNVSPDLSHYAGIVPCGLRDYGVTSLKALGCQKTLCEVEAALRRTFEQRYGPTCAADPPLMPSDIG